MTAHRVPFYPWIRAGFLLYLISPQTQGAKVLYQTHVHPFLQEHETAIEDFISSAHDRAKTAGINYLKQAIELVKEHLLGLPPQKPSAPQAATNQSYTQSLIARFNLPSARSTTASVGSAATSTAADFYTLLASAVSAATSASTPNMAQFQERDLSNSGTLIPPTIQGTDRLSWIYAQRERLSILLSALDKEASNLKTQDSAQNLGTRAISSTSLDGSSGSEGEPPRPPSAMSGLSKSRSELDFEKIDKDDNEDEDAATPMPSMVRQNTGGWLPWSWGSKSEAVEPSKYEGSDKGKSSGVDL